MKRMMSSGRTPEQGAQLYNKDTPEYSRETSYCFLHPMDCMEIGVEEGDHVLISSTAGETVFYVRESPETLKGLFLVRAVRMQTLSCMRRLTQQVRRTLRAWLSRSSRLTVRSNQHGI